MGPLEACNGDMLGPSCMNGTRSRCEPCFPRSLPDRKVTFFCMKWFLFFFLPSHWSFYIISFQDSFKFTNNAKSFFLEVAERVNVSPFQVYNKEESPRDSADDHKPQSPQHVFLTWCQSDISRMMTWLQRSAGDLLCVAANSAAFEKTLDITESLKLTFKHDSGFSHQLISAIIIVH